MMLFPMLTLGGCIMDYYDAEPDFPEAPETEKVVGYMSVMLNSSNSTRALGDDYDIGVSNDVALSTEANHYAIIYSDSKTTPAAIGLISPMSRDENPDPGASVVYATIIAHNEDKEVLKQYKDCYVIINTSVPIDDVWTMTKSDLTDIKLDSPFFVDKSGRKFLTMSSSVYVENGSKKIHTEIDTNMIFASSMEALEQAWKGNAAITAYVERASARFELKFDKEEYNVTGADRIYEPAGNTMIVFSDINPNGIPYYTSGPDPLRPSAGTYSYKVRITGWDMNALERRTYLFRNFNPSANYFTNWYKTGDKRAFWSEDLNYSKAVYPFQYRRVIDNTGIPVYSTKIVNGKNENILLNKSFAELSVNRFTSQYVYTPENTYDLKDATFSPSLDNRIEYLAGTHMIICAEVLTNLDDVNTWTARDLYRDRNNNFYRSERDVFKALLSEMNRVFESHASLQYKYYDWTHGGVEVKLFAKTSGPCGIYLGNTRLTPDNFETVMAQYGGQLTSDAEFRGSDGKRIIWNDAMQILDSNGRPLEIYTYIDDIEPKNNQFYRYATVDDFKSLIFEHVGAVDHFRDGKMYYAVPIGYLQGSNPASDNQRYDTYGVVRNSEYQINIKDVTGLGTPVDNPDEPVIPNGNATNDKLYVGFKILNWHLTEETVPGLL